MLFDTDVLVWVLRGNSKAAAMLQPEGDRRASVVTYMELLQGARDKREAAGIKAFLSRMGIRLVPLTENIGHRASICLEENGLRMGICVADALIAATAIENRLTLCTANLKHYRLVRDLEIVPFRA